MLPSVAFHFVFILACQPPAITSSLLFLPDQAEKGGVGSTWVRNSRLPPISRHLPACYQSTLYSHPAENQPALKETEEDLVWWRYGVRERENKGEEAIDKDRNRGKKHQEAGRQLLVEHPKFTTVLRFPVIFDSCAVKRSVSLLSPDTHSHTCTGTVKSLILLQLHEQPLRLHSKYFTFKYMDNFQRVSRIKCANAFNKVLK